MENERERDVIAGRNAVTEALKAGRPIDSILVRRGEKNGSVSSILRMAKQAGIPRRTVQDWCGEKRACPTYVRFLLAEHFGLL